MTAHTDIPQRLSSNLSLERHPKQASAAESCSFFWRLLAFIFPNYAGRPVKSTNKGRVVRFCYLPEREADLKKALYTASDYENFFLFPVVLSELYLLYIKLPDGARLVARTTELNYRKYKCNPNMPISVDYREGRFDGIPQLYPTGSLFQPPDPRYI